MYGGLICMSVSSRPAVCPPMALEDEELMRDTEVETPVKQGGIRKKERPTEKGVSWLVNTEYISSLNMDTAKMVWHVFLQHFLILTYLVKILP